MEICAAETLSYFQSFQTPIEIHLMHILFDTNSMKKRKFWHISRGPQVWCKNPDLDVYLPYRPPSLLQNQFVGIFQWGYLRIDKEIVFSNQMCHRQNLSDSFISKNSYYQLLRTG